MFSSAVEVSLRYSNRNVCESAAVLVNRSNAQDDDPVKCNTGVNTGAAAPGLYEVPVSQNQSQYETIREHKTYAKTDAAAPGLYELPVSVGQSQYEDVVEHRTVGPVTGSPLYEGVAFGASSAASSLFYQYVPSKVRNLLEKHT